MKARRRLSRRAWERAGAVALQRRRLEAIARGDAEPLSLREEFFLRTLRADGRADPADFIIPATLLRLEVMAEVEPRNARARAGPVDAGPEAADSTASTASPGADPDVR